MGSVARELSLSDPTDFTEFCRSTWTLIENFQQSTVVENHVGRYSLFAREFETFGFECLPERIFVGFGEGLAAACVSLFFGGAAFNGFGIAP